jgi:hypothetical protein
MVDWNEILTAHGPTVWRTVYWLLGRHDDALDSPRRRSSPENLDP